MNDRSIFFYFIILLLPFTEAYIRHHLLYKSARKFKFIALSILFFLSILSVIVKYLIENDHKIYGNAFKHIVIWHFLYREVPILSVIAIYLIFFPKYLCTNLNGNRVLII